MAQSIADLKEARAVAWQQALQEAAGEGVNPNDLPDEAREFAIFRAERAPAVRELDGKIKALRARQEG